MDRARRKQYWKKNLHIHMTREDMKEYYYHAHTLYAYYTAPSGNGAFHYRTLLLRDRGRLFGSRVVTLVGIKPKRWGVL